MQDLDGNPLPDGTLIVLQNVVFASPSSVLEVIVQPLSSSLDVLVVVSPVSEQATVLVSAQLPEGVAGFQFSFFDSEFQTVGIAPDGHSLLFVPASSFEILASPSSITVFSASGSTIPSSSSNPLPLIEVQLAGSVGAGEEICLQDVIFTSTSSEEFPVSFSCSIPPPPADVVLSVTPAMQSMIQVDIETTTTISSLQFDLVPEDPTAISGLQIQDAEFTVSEMPVSSSFNENTFLSFLLSIGAGDTASILFELLVKCSTGR